jgi:(S)-mandelate dehydrogenase
MQGVVNIEDLRKLAKKRLPKIAYDFIEGGTDDEVGLVTNEQAFRKARIVPRYLVDVSVRDQSTTLFGRTYSSPIGIAPTGLAGLFRRGADLMLAEAARDANVPFIMSGSSTGSMEALGKLAPDHGWYQLYSAKDQAISEDMIKRAGDAGLKTLVFTIDVPEGSNRERNARNGWGRPLKLTWKTKFEALLHPAWMMEWMKHGTPYFDNWAKYAGPGADAEKIADMVGYQNRAPMTWKHVERYRALWKGNFVLKGIMHPDDAIRAHSLGVDGLMVSNHGARQLDNAPSPLEVLPAVNAAVGDKMPADALRRDRGRHPRGEDGAQHLPPRDRHQHGADGCSQDLRPRAAVPDVEGRGGSAPQQALMPAIDFYLGLGSRYSYLAASQVDRIEKTYGCRFVWKPIASGALMDRRGGNPFRGEPLSGQYDWRSGRILRCSHWPAWQPRRRTHWCRVAICCSG